MRRTKTSPDAGPAAFQAATGVSRETRDRLEVYADLLIRWTQKINLVAKTTIPDLWTRHFVDSAQLAPLITNRPRIIDVGTGAGFPGLVLAIMDLGSVILVESDKRKAAFLREVARQTQTDVRIIADRVESVREHADIITARAFAPLPRLLDLTQNLVDNETQYLLLKGQDIDEELTQATTSWNMTVERRPSRTDPRGVILQLTQVQRR